MGVLPSSYGAAPLDRLPVLQAHDVTELPGVHDLLDCGVYGVYRSMRLMASMTRLPAQVAFRAHSPRSLYLVPATSARARPSVGNVPRAASFWFGVVVGATPRTGELRRGETISWRVIAAQIAPTLSRGSR